MEPTNLTHIIVSGMDPATQCQLMQLDMINQLGKLPENAILLVGLALAAMIIHLYIRPWFPTKYYELTEHAFILFATALLVFASLILVAFTYKTTTLFWNIAEATAFIIVLATVGLYYFKNKEKLKEKWKEFMEDRKQ